MEQVKRCRNATEMQQIRSYCNGTEMGQVRSYSTGTGQELQKCDRSGAAALQQQLQQWNRSGTAEMPQVRSWSFAIGQELQKFSRSGDAALQQVRNYKNVKRQELQLCNSNVAQGRWKRCSQLLSVSKKVLKAAAHWEYSIFRGVG